MSKQYTYIERRIPATPRNKRLTDAIVAASSTGGGYIGGGGGASYWQLVTTDADGNALAEEDQYLVPVGAYNVMSEMDVVAYSTGGKDIILPIASPSALGAIKVGKNLTITDDGTLNAEAGGVSSWNELTDKPTTLAGYGITDAAKASDLTTHINNTVVHITADERTNWNDANSKKHTHSNKSYLDSINQNLSKTSDVTFKSVAATGEVIAYSTGSGDIVLPIASPSALGAIKVGSGLSIDSSGVLSATGAGSIAGIITNPNTGNVLTGATLSADGKTITFTKDLTAWHAGNDGSGSGLDADLLDGLQATAFARTDQKPAVDLNTVNGFGIMCNTYNSNATTERNYPIAEAGVLFYGTAAYDSANQIYGSYSSNRWFARGGGYSTTAKTTWKEFAFKTDNVASATNADMLDGIHASGLFTNLSNSGNNLSVTIGGTNKTLTVGYASNADMLDGLHSNNFTRSWYLGGTVDAKTNYIVFGKAYTDTLITGFTFIGTIAVKRGSAGSWHNFDNINISISAQYSTNYFAFTCTGLNALTYRVVTLVYNSETYLALEISKHSTMYITVYGSVYDNIDLFLASADNVSNVTAVSTASNTFKAGLITSTQGITSQTYIHATNDIVAYSAGSGDIVLPVASASALGAIKVGNGLSIDSNGVLSATGAGSIAGIAISPNTGNVLTGATLSADGKTITFTKDVTALTTTNYSSTLDTRYVKKSGDTMTGALTATRFVSNIATGTSPLSVASTTLCTNLNADMLDGYHLGQSWGNIPYIAAADGVMEIGKYIDFHYVKDESIDYSTRLMVTGQHQNTVNLPSNSGTLALTTDTVSNADKLDGIHANGLFTNLSNSGNNISVTIGRTNKTLTVGYASNSDLLDGYHASSLESYKLTVIDASGLNNNTWYPVTMEIGNSLQTRIRIEGKTAANASWNTRTDKMMSLILDYTVNGSYWGWTSPFRTVNAYQEGAGCSKCLRGLGQLTNSSTEYVYVRGGAKYNFYVSRFITPVLRTSTFTASNQSVAPTTTEPAAITRNVALITDNVASATKLQTSRLINGTYFNGTDDITTANWGTARNISIADSDITNTGTAVSVNGSQDVTLKLPSTIKAALSGNATSAGKLSTSHTFWGKAFNGTQDVSGNMTDVGSIDASGTIKTTSDVIAYSTGTATAPFKYWYPSVDDSGNISWVDSVSTTKPTPKNIRGPKGPAGTITDASASIDSNTGTPKVSVSLGGTESARTFSFSFQNLKGATGASISKVELSGNYNSASEGTNTYNVYAGSTNVGSFKVTNGKQGSQGDPGPGETNTFSGSKFFQWKGWQGLAMRNTENGVSYGFGIRESVLKVLYKGNTTSNPDAMTAIASISSTGQWTGSDERLKNMQSEVNDVLNFMDNIPVWRYDVKIDPLHKTTIGITTQSIQPYFPECVDKLDETYFALNYSSVGCIAFQGVKELHALVKSQQAKIVELEKRLAMLESK